MATPRAKGKAAAEVADRAREARGSSLPPLDCALRQLAVADLRALRDATARALDAALDAAEGGEAATPQKPTRMKPPDEAAPSILSAISRHERRL